MKKLYFKLLPALLLFAISAGSARAQDAIYIDGPVFIGAADLTQWYGDVTFGPDAEIYIEDGAAPLFYGKNMIVNPGANFYSYPGMNQTGTGTFVFKQANPLYGDLGQQTLDGGYSTGTQPSLLGMEVNNAAGVSLTGHATRVTNTVAFTNGHIFLNEQDLILDNDAVFTGYNENKYAVTNSTSTNGHVVKEGYSSAFEFPVGRAVSDYTPATITPSATNSIHVLVQSYATSAANEAGSNGMQRTWNIYGGSSTVANISLQHNSVTNQSNFTDASHFVTRWSNINPNGTGDNSLSETSWQSNTFGAGVSGSIAGSSIRSRDYTDLATSAISETAYYSKSSNQIHPLPVKLISTAVTVANCNVVYNWKVGEESIGEYKVQHSSDGRLFETLGIVRQKGNNSEYNYVHTNAGDGKHMYRLEIVGQNGGITYSGTSAATVSCKGDVSSITLSPNPTNGLSTLVGLKEGQRIELYNVAGQCLISRQASGTSMSINMGTYAPGNYLVVIKDDKIRIQMFKVVNTN
jgi:hypothetical protein